MTDETDISQEKAWFYEERARTVIKNLQRKNINGQYVPSRQEALTAILGMIPPGGGGGSWRLDYHGADRNYYRT